jgi:hypothetical protein
LPLPGVDYHKHVVLFHDFHFGTSLCGVDFKLEQQCFLNRNIYYKK